MPAACKGRSGSVTQVINKRTLNLPNMDVHDHATLGHLQDT